jgi:murein tripeptide amidase MpaA
VITVSSHFDSGAIEVVTSSAANDIQLRIRPDTHSDPQVNFSQWFHFRLQGVQGDACRIQLLNAGECTYPDGWVDYRAVASYDREHWFRVPTQFDGQKLTIEFTPEHDSVWLAYFEPYSEERHLQLIGRCQRQPGVRARHLGHTVEGRDMTALTIGEQAPGRRQIWIIARQHPGETMAEWFCEGLLERVTGQGMWAADPVSRMLLERAVLHVVPNMNPDGAARGNLRTNAAGANLNREWMAPDEARSPEVMAVRDAIHATGCDMFFDIHGDEGLPYVFVAGSEMLPGFTDRQRSEQQRFIDAFMRASPDFQNTVGYPAGKYNEDALKLASKYIGHAYGCLSLTLEMPFKDNANLPDPQQGWSAQRSKLLGAAMVQPLLEQLQPAPVVSGAGRAHAL